MTEISVSLKLYGKSFYPSKLPKEFIKYAKDILDRDEIGRIGRYKNVPSQYGYLNINAPNFLNIEDSISWCHTKFKEFSDDLNKWGMSEAYLDIAVWTNSEIHVDLDLKTLKLLNEINLPIKFSFYSETT